MEENIRQSEDVQALLTLLQQATPLKMFRDALAPQDLEEFAHRANFSTNEQGDQIINQGEPGDDFYIVMDGQLRAVDIGFTPPHLLSYHDTGELVGMRALLGNRVRTATVEVVINAKLATFDEDDWYWLIGKNSRFQNFFEDLEQRRVERSETNFPGRQWDEVVVEATKRHVIALISTLPVPLALLIAPILFLLIANLLNVQFVTATSFILALLIIVPFVILSAFLMLYNYFDWRNDDFIVTTKRVIHIERFLFFGEKRRDAPLTRIQDVTDISDFLDLLFDSDTVSIQTAGAGTIVFDHIRRAREVRQAIFRERARARARGAAADISALRHNLASQFNYRGDLKENIMAVAEAEGTLDQQQTTSHYNRFIDYFIPRIKEVNDIGDGTVVVWRKHYYVLLVDIILPTICLLVLTYLLMATFMLWPPFGSFVLWPIQLALGIAIFACFFWYLVKYDDWSKDVYMVTNTQIIDIEASAFKVRKVRREGTFDSIQAVYSGIPNIFYKLLNLGDVIIETAGTEDTFTFHQVFDPASVNEEIFNRWAVFKQREREEDRDATHDQVMEVLREYHKLIGTGTQN